MESSWDIKEILGDTKNGGLLGNPQANWASERHRAMELITVADKPVDFPAARHFCITQYFINIRRPRQTQGGAR